MSNNNSNNNNNKSNNQYDLEAQQGKATIRISNLPHHVQASAKKIDIDCDGALGAEDVATVINDLDKKTKANCLLRKAIVAFGVMGLLLIAGVFAVSITAARLSQNIAVDPTNGFAHAKGDTNAVMKTAEAILYEDGSDFGSLSSNEQLQSLKKIILDNGNISFTVNGYARAPFGGTVVLQVEGGTLTLDEVGIVDAHGDAKSLLEVVYGPLPEQVVGNDEHQHYVSWDNNGHNDGSRSLSESDVVLKSEPATIVFGRIV